MIFLKEINLCLTIIYISIFLNVDYGLSKGVSDYLILNDPDSLRIYNKYEQKLAAADRLLLGQHSALLIKNTNAFLSDGFTPCITASIDNQLYYIVTDETQPSSVASYTIIKNTTSLNDTIQVIDHFITLLDPGDNAGTDYSSPAKLKRIFQKFNKTFVKTLSPPFKYGWIDLKNKSAWQIVKNEKKNAHSIDADVELIINQYLKDVNDTLYKLFLHFNDAEKTAKTAPFWHVVKEKDNYFCALVNGQQADFTESTRILISDLQLALSKTGYKVGWQEDKIIISR